MPNRPSRTDLQAAQANIRLEVRRSWEPERRCETLETDTLRLSNQISVLADEFKRFQQDQPKQVSSSVKAKVKRQLEGLGVHRIQILEDRLDRLEDDLVDRHRQLLKETTKICDANRCQDVRREVLEEHLASSTEAINRVDELFLEIFAKLDEMKLVGEQREHRFAQEITRLGNALSDEVAHREEKFALLSEEKESLDEQLVFVSRTVQELRLDQQEVKDQVQSLETILFQRHRMILEDMASLRKTVNEQGHRDDALRDQVQGLKTVLVHRSKTILEEMATLRDMVNKQDHQHEALQERLANSEQRCKQLIEETRDSWFSDRQAMQESIRGLTERQGWLQARIAQVVHAMEEMHAELLQDLPQQEHVDHLHNRLRAVVEALGLPIQVDLPTPELDHPASGNSSTRSPESSDRFDEASSEGLIAAYSSNSSSEEALVPSEGSNHTLLRTQSPRSSDLDQA